MFRITGRHGLRWKFNLALLPAVAVILGVLGLMDSAHEREVVLAAHVMHASDAVLPVAVPLNPTPEAVARRSLFVHGVYAFGLLSLIALALNLALSRFVLKPLDLVRHDISQMERGHWRLPAHLAEADEVGSVVESMHPLGLTIDALVAHMIRAERMATQAALAARTTAKIEPRTTQIGAAVSRLYERPDGASREAAAQIATATAEILMAVRELDRLFDATLSSASSTRAVPRQRQSELGHRYAV